MENSKSLFLFSLISVILLWATILFLSSVGYAFNTFESVSTNRLEPSVNQTPSIQIDSPLEEV